MSALEVAQLPNEPLGPMIRRVAREHSYDVKSKLYRRSPVGHQVGRYIDGLKYAGHPATTTDSYEQPLAWFSAWFDDVPDLTVFCERGGDEKIECFLAANYGGKAENTRAHRWKVLRYFFDWALAKGMVPFNPMASVQKPRRPRTVRERVAYEQALVHALIDAQETLRDRCALGVLRLALRKNDLAMLQLRDIDLARDVLRLNHAKGGERHRLPIVLPDLAADLAAHMAERTLIAGRDPGDEYLLHPRSHPDRPMNPATVHRWFKRCLENAGLPSSIQMHELRHTAADHMWRSTGNPVLAQKLLRHKNIATTMTYLHPSDEDLRAGLRQVVRSAAERDG